MVNNTDIKTGIKTGILKIRQLKTNSEADSFWKSNYVCTRGQCRALIAYLHRSEDAERLYVQRMYAGKERADKTCNTIRITSNTDSQEVKKREMACNCHGRAAMLY